MKLRHGFRSRFELDFATNMVKRKIKFSYEPKKLEYVVPNKFYTPDFYLEEQDIYLELKGVLEKPDRVKHLLIQKQYPTLDIRFIFGNSKNKIYKGSKTSYGQWCDRHSILYADNTIPKEWLNDC